jgi:hypothetical protein
MENLATSLLTNEELAACATRLLPPLADLFAGETFLAEVRRAASSDLASIHAAGTRELKNKLTDPVRDADAVRDQAFASLRDFVNAWADNLIATPEQRAAGERLRGIFVKHGISLHRRGYTVQTGLLEALFVELSSKVSQADLALVNLIPLHQQLVQAQTAFEALWKKKAGSAGAVELPRVKEHLPNLKRRLNLLLEAAEEWSRLNPAPDQAKLLAELDGLVQEMMTSVLARQTRAKKQATRGPKPTDSKGDTESSRS